MMGKVRRGWEGEGLTPTHESYLAFSISGTPGGAPIWFMATRIPKAFIEEVMRPVGMSLYLEGLGGPGGSNW